MPTGGMKKQSLRPAVSRILVATDFSAQAEVALQWALHLADGFGAKLVLLHVLDVTVLSTSGFTLVGPSPVPPLLTEGKRDMQRWRKLAPDAEVVIRRGSPRPIIVESALRLRCQLIVMGTHGRSGLAHLLMGSVAEYVVRCSWVPVLTVRKH